MNVSLNGRVEDACVVKAGPADLSNIEVSQLELGFMGLLPAIGFTEVAHLVAMSVS